MSPLRSPSSSREALSLAHVAIYKVALQHRRLHDDEPEDDTFPYRRVADLQFFVIALNWLRRAASLVAKHHPAPASVLSAIKDFDRAIPMLRNLRSGPEPLDDAAALQDLAGLTSLSDFRPPTFTWGDEVLDVDAAKVAAEHLFWACKRAIG